MNELAKISEAEYQEIEAVIFYAIKLIGVPPEKLMKEDISIIISYLQRNFKYYPVVDIRNAFEAGVRGDLDFNMNHYHSFNSMYVANVLQAYKRYTLQYKRSHPSKFIDSDAPKALTFDQARYIAKKAEEDYLKTGSCGEVNWTAVFEYLEKDGKINMTNDQKRDFMIQTKIQIADELKKAQEEGKTGILLSLCLEFEMFLVCECRKRKVLNYFKTLKDATM